MNSTLFCVELESFHSQSNVVPWQFAQTIDWSLVWAEVGVETLDVEFPKQCQDMAKAGKRWPKAKKGLYKDDSLYIFKTTGVFVAVGSGKYSYSSWILFPVLQRVDNVTQPTNPYPVDGI